jgi:hypothetical protein
VTLAATASSGLPPTFTLNSGPAGLSGTTLTITGGGASVVITASQAGDAQYLGAPNVKQSIWVDKHPLTVKADDKSMQYGGAVPTLTWTASGFVNGDTVTTALHGAPVVQTNATPNWAPGKYGITISAGSLASDKYRLSFAPGTLTILPLGRVADPTFSPAAGTYTGAQSVRILDTSTPCTIYYTIDGSTPSPTHGTKYSGAFVVSASQTVRAIATKAGYTSSPVVSAAYVLQ